MSHRIEIVEEKLGVSLPKEYKKFIDDIGIISDERGEIYGYIEEMDITKVPCVIAATKLYKENYDKLLPEHIVISFDDFLNVPIILNTKDGKVYLYNILENILISSNFSTWLLKKIYNKSS